MGKAGVKVEGDTVGIRFSDETGFHWLSLDEIRAFQEDLTVAVWEAWVNHEERLVEEVLKNTGVAG